MRRPTHADLVREPAGGRVSPDPCPRGTPREPDASRHRHRSTRRRCLRHGGPSGPPRPRRPRRCGPGGCAEDERIQGPARVRAGRRHAVDAGRRRRHSRHRRAGGPPRPADRHDGVHEGGPGWEGLHRRDACRLGLGHLRVQPARCGPARRSRSPSPGTISTPSLPASSPSTRPSGSSAIAIRGPSRCRPPQPLGESLIEEGSSIPGGRVQAMHEGKRRARAAKKDG